MSPSSARVGKAVVGGLVAVLAAILRLLLLAATYGVLRRVEGRGR